MTPGDQSSLPLPPAVVEAAARAVEGFRFPGGAGVGTGVHASEVAEVIVRAAFTEMRLELEVHAHDTGYDALGGGYDGYQARCWDCDWRGPERPPGADGKSQCRADYALHDVVERRYVGPWLPVEGEPDE